MTAKKKTKLGVTATLGAQMDASKAEGRRRQAESFKKNQEALKKLDDRHKRALKKFK